MRKTGLSRRFIAENYELPGVTDIPFSGTGFEERLGKAYQDVRESRKSIDNEASWSAPTGLGPQLTDPWIHPGLRRFAYNQLLDPANFRSHSTIDVLKVSGTDNQLKFFCQHPRWHQRGRYDKGQQTATSGNKAPASVYMHHSPARNLTLYLIVAPEDGEWFSFVDRIQQDHDSKDDPKATPKAIATSPFMLHALIGSIAFEQSTDYTAEIRTRLMEQLKKINFDEEPGNGIPTRAVNTLRDMEGRFELEGITIHLNQVSQMINTGLSSVFSSIQHSERLLSAHKTFCERNHIGTSGTLVDRTNGILHYLLDAFRCQQNYLNGYNLRKETAMNFVFHIVTQQDSATNLKVAYRMSNDSSSMNTVTILTMIFLPGTFTATVFSSVAFRAADSGAAETTEYLWPFISVAIALTVSVIGFWYWWRRLNTVKPSKAYSM
ncbi:hypothetical protein QQZ08_011382 [Neonectria magnoliae]|uniref:Uncharacterized protein n=1 Tax=Neonectria magnoliae TaxID=2732573 RepID=A0ABR1HAH3_9HYPO